jgi:hypothetical protein
MQKSTASTHPDYGMLKETKNPFPKEGLFMNLLALRACCTLQGTPE